MRTRIAIGVAIALITVGIFAPAASAAKGPNPCTLLKPSEITKTLGGTVGKGAKTNTTPISTRCKFAVGETADHPSGTVITSVMFIGAKAAYDGLSTGSTGYVAVTGLSKALYASNVGVVDVLKGNLLIGVQGLYAGAAVTQDQLVALIKIELKRV